MAALQHAYVCAGVMERKEGSGLASVTPPASAAPRAASLQRGWTPDWSLQGGGKGGGRSLLRLTVALRTLSGAWHNVWPALCTVGTALHHVLRFALRAAPCIVCGALHCTLCFAFRAALCIVCGALHCTLCFAFRAVPCIVCGALPCRASCGTLCAASHARTRT
eukprot:361903-Chlamydomonas_euryale.AAC.2